MFIAALFTIVGLSWWLSGKELPVNTGNGDWISGLGRNPREGNGNPLQYSCLANSMADEPGELQSIGSQKSQIQLRD